MRTPAENADLVAKKSEIGYVDPPDDLVPAKGPDEEPVAWNRLFEYFEDCTENAYDAILVFFVEKANVSLGEAYIYTDGWVKHRVQVDDEGNYISYN